MESWKLFALGSAVFAGLTAVLAKVGVKNISSDFATFIRTVVIFIFLAAMLSLRQEWQNPSLLSKKSLMFLVLSGLTTGLSWLCYYKALQTGPASLVAPIDKLSLLVAVVFSVLFLGERLNFYTVVGISLIFAGTMVVIFKSV